MSKKNQNYTNRKQNRFQPERMRGNVFVNNSGKQWLPGENGRAAKVERLLRGAKEEKKEIAGNMAGYKDSWVEYIGQVPKDWVVLRLKNISDIYAAKEYLFGEWPVEKNGKPYSPFDEWASGNEVIITGRVGTIGQYEMLEKNPKKKILINDNRLLICPFTEEYRKKALSNFLFWAMAIVNLNDIITGSAVPLITAKSLLKKRVVIPPLPEQQRIADFLDTKCDILDRTIDAVSRQIEDLEKYKKALITKTVTKGICKKDEPERAMKDSGVEWIGEVPEEWSVKRLKYVLDSIRNGASAASYEYEPGSFRYVRITDIDDNGNLKQTGKQYLPKEMAKNFILNKKAVLIANTGSLGKAMLFDPDKEDEVCALNGHLIEAIANPNIISNEYLYFFIKSYNYINWVNRSYVQTTMQMLSAGRHKNLPVTVPSLAEQQQIADYLDEKCKNIDNRVQKRRQ